MFPIFSILAQAAPAADAVQQRVLPGWAILLIAVTIFGLPFFFGSMISKALKMKEYSLKISLILLAIFLGISPIASQYVLGYTEQNTYEQSMEEFEKREQDYGGITPKGLSDLKAKLPKLQPIAKRALRESQKADAQK